MTESKIARIADHFIPDETDEETMQFEAEDAALAVAQEAAIVEAIDNLPTSPEDTRKRVQAILDESAREAAIADFLDDQSGRVRTPRGGAIQ